MAAFIGEDSVQMYAYFTFSLTAEGNNAVESEVLM